MEGVVLVEETVVGGVCCEFRGEVFEVFGVPPGAAEAAVGEGDEDADGEH